MGGLREDLETQFCEALRQKSLFSSTASFSLYIKVDSSRRHAHRCKTQGLMGIEKRNFSFHILLIYIFREYFENPGISETIVGDEKRGANWIP